LNGIWAAVTRNGARTERDSPDAALRGRTYTIPFDRVWNAALALASGEHRGWRVVAYDDLFGEIHAVAPRRLIGEKADVRVRVRLDANGQTRVDVESKSRGSTRDWGANRQRIRRLIKALDNKLGATPAQILSDPLELTPTGNAP
jgi:hypothetical protein